MKTEEPLKTFAVRLDKKKVVLAREFGIDISELFRFSLDKALLDHSQHCPLCKRKLKVT